MWDEDFLCCEDLGNIEPSLVNSIPPFQWSESPLADEADNSDMTPQCMPVIDPLFVRESTIEDCLIGIDMMLNILTSSIELVNLS